MPEIVYLDLSSPEIQYLCRRDKHLAKLISMVGPISYEKRGSDDAFPFVVHEIVEQMMSSKAAATIYERIVVLCEGHVCPESICSLSVEELRSVGTSESKARCIKYLAEAVIDKELVFDDLPLMTNEEVTNKLTSFRRIGPWTAKMYLMFVLDRPDILPFEDGAFLQTYRWLYKTEDCSPSAVLKKCKKWKPYSTIASRYMYRALDYGLTKEEFHLFKD